MKTKVSGIFTQNNNVEMSVIEALSKVKTLSASIDKEISKAKFYTLDNELETSKRATERLQSIEDKISLLGRLKANIAISNATTKITILGKEIKVIEAIVIRDSLVNYFRNLNNKLLDNYRNKEYQIKQSIETAKQTAGDRNGDDLTKFIEVVKLKCTDSLNFEEEIENYNTQLEELEDIENKLNISNISTKITV